MKTISIGQILKYSLKEIYLYCDINSLIYLNNVAPYFLTIINIYENSNEFSFDSDSKNYIDINLFKDFTQLINNVDFVVEKTVTDYFLEYMSIFYNKINEQNMDKVNERWKNLVENNLNDSKINIEILESQKNTLVEIIENFKKDGNLENFLSTFNRFNGSDGNSIQIQKDEEFFLTKLLNAKWDDFTSYYGYEIFNFNDKILQDIFSLKVTEPGLNSVYNIDQLLINNLSMFQVVSGCIDKIYNISINDLSNYVFPAMDDIVMKLISDSKIYKEFKNILKKRDRCNILIELQNKNLIKSLSDYYQEIYSHFENLNLNKIYLDTALVLFPYYLCKTFIGQYFDPRALTSYEDRVNILLSKTYYTFLKHKKRLLK